MGWLSGWKYRRELTITEQSGTNLTYYQVLVDLTDYELVNAASDGTDVRFTDDDGTTLLSFWRERFDGTAAGQVKKFWVKVPSIPASGSKTIYVYWGNSGASDASDGDATFLFFDDFEGTELDSSKWETYITGSGSVSVSDGCVWFSTGTTESSVAFIRSVNDTFGWEGVCIEDRFMALTDSTEAVARPHETNADQDDNNKVHISHRGSGGDERVNRKYEGSWEASQVIYEDPPINTWLRHRITNNGDVTLSLLDDDGNTLGSHTYSGWDLTLNWISGIGSYNYKATVNLESKTDFIIVRKYVDPEPTVSIGAFEGREELSVSTTVTPSITAKKTSYVTLSASTSVSAALSRVASIHRQLSVSTVASATLSKKLTAYRQLSVSTAVTSTLSVKTVYHAELSVSTSVTSTLTRKATLVRQLSVSTTPAVTLDRKLTAYRQFSVSTSITSTISIAKVILREFAVATTPTATLTRKIAASRTISKTVAVTSTLRVLTKEELCGLPDFITSANIRMQTLGRLRVDIVAQSIGNLAVNIASQSITLDVNITNASLDVNVTNSVLYVNITDSVTLDVNVTNTSLDVNVTNSELNVNITNTTLDVNITNSTLDVNITNTEVGVKITASSVTLDINAEGGTIDNVNYTDAIIKSNCFEGAIGRGDYGGNKYTFAHTPSGYVLYFIGGTLSVYNSDTSTEKEGWLGVYNPCVGSEQIIADVVVPPESSQSVDVSVATPVKIPYGGYFFVKADTNAYPVGTVRVVLVSSSVDIETLGDLMEKGKLMTFRWPPIEGVDGREFADKRQHRSEGALQEASAKM